MRVTGSYGQAKDDLGHRSLMVEAGGVAGEAKLTALEAKLKAREGRNVKITTKVDPELLGGLVVTIGSKRIDSSIRTRLNSLAQAMKGHPRYHVFDALARQVERGARPHAAATHDHDVSGSWRTRSATEPVFHTSSRPAPPGRDQNSNPFRSRP